MQNTVPTVQNNAMPAAQPVMGTPVQQPTMVAPMQQPAVAAPVPPVQPGVAMVAAPAQPVQPAQPAQAKGGKGGLYAVICVSILAVAAVVIFVIALSTGLIGGEAKKDEGKEEQVAVVNTYQVKAANWTFEVPTNYAVYNNGKVLVLTDNNDKSWALGFIPMAGNLKNLNKAALISAYQAKGITVNNVQKTYDGYKFEVFELSAGGNATLVAYADLNGSYVMGVEIQTSTGEFAHDKLSIVASIMKKATYNVTTNMNSNTINGLEVVPSFN